MIATDLINCNALGRRVGVTGQHIRDIFKGRRRPSKTLAAKLVRVGVVLEVHHA